MVLLSSNIQTTLANKASGNFDGVIVPSLIEGIAESLFSWFLNPIEVALLGTTTGLLGVGSVQGTFSLITNPAIYVSAFNANGFNGTLVHSLASFFSESLVTIMEDFATYQAPVGAGSGADVSAFVTANPISLQALLETNLDLKFQLFSPLGYTGKGALLPSFTTALANAFSVHLLTATGTGIVVGVNDPSLTPVVLPSNGFIV